MKPSINFSKVKLIKSHFKKVDPIIYEVIVKMNSFILPKPQNSKIYFAKLCREIISQQLASHAADAILSRFLNLFPNQRPIPDQVLLFTEQKLRDVGMSWAKARYVRDLALQVKNKKVALEKLHKMNDEEVIAELTKVKGVGKWTAEMFLIFTLGRENIFSFGDLGLKRAAQKLYGFKTRPDDKHLAGIVQKWEPFKSYGSLALWESLDNK